MTFMEAGKETTAIHLAAGNNLIKNRGTVSSGQKAFRWEIISEEFNRKLACNVIPQ